MRIRTIAPWLTVALILLGTSWVQQHLPINRFGFECADCPGAKCARPATPGGS